MTLYRITRTTTWNEKPCDEAFECMVPLEDHTAWFVRAASIEELFKRYGTLVIHTPYGSCRDEEIEVEIYDGYRE